MSLAQFARNGEYPGPDLLAAWYQRNIRIYSNMRSIIDSPDDRVLVIYGRATCSGCGAMFMIRRT